MVCRRFLLTYLLTTLLLMGAGLPAYSAETKVSGKLLEELRQLTRESREKQAADRWLQRALDDLVARYDRPWQRTILFEDFSDGDYTRNPSWQLMEGRFDVVRGQGLVGHQDNAGQAVTQESPKASSGTAQPDLTGALVGALLDQAFGPKPGARQETAPTQTGQPQYGGPNRLRLKAGVSNAFALTATLRASADTRFGITLMQSEQERYGYRLKIDVAGKGLVELERVRNGMGAIVESRPLNVKLGDDRLHDLNWRQAPDGTVSVLIDENPVFSVRDRAFRDGYPWLELVHNQGDLTLRSLSIEGT